VGVGGGDAMARQVAEMYSSGAEVYERLWAPALAPLGEELVRALPLEQARQLLDAGTGVGTLRPVLRRAAPGATVVGVDISLGMLRRGDRESPRAAMDLRRLAFAGESFDAVVAPFVLFHIPGPEAARDELVRVLRPGGWFAAITWEGEPEFLAQRIWTEELDRAAPSLETPTTVHDPVSSAEAMTAFCEAAGLVEVRTRLRPFGYRFQLESFLELRAGLGGSGRRVATLSDEGRAELLRRVRERLGELSEDDFVDSGNAIYTWARRSQRKQGGIR
jgi:ubiquinone/menaquinone biosynthesis C-methylase UbiE